MVSTNIDIDWKEYPNTKPERDGQYLVTLLSEDGLKKVVRRYFWDNPSCNELGRWFGSWDTAWVAKGFSVIAWAEKPYIKYTPFSGDGFRLVS